MECTKSGKNITSKAFMTKYLICHMLMTIYALLHILFLMDFDLCSEKEHSDLLELKLTAFV